MIENKKDKGFDCLDFKEKAQTRIYERIKDLTPEEQIEYFRDRAENGPLGDWWKSLREDENPLAKSSKN